MKFCHKCLEQSIFQPLFLCLLFDDQWSGVVVVVFVVFVVTAVAQWEGFRFPASAVTGFFAHIGYVYDVNNFWCVQLDGGVDSGTRFFVDEWEDSVQKLEKIAHKKL